MKHVYPLRHPPSMDSAPQGQTLASREHAREPSLPHEHDESSSSQASAAPQHKDVGKKAYGNVTDGTADTDRGAQMDKIYNESLADRGADKPRQ
jgi:hypothetical protein